jgi:hypothetical protein
LIATDDGTGNAVGTAQKLGHQAELPLSQGTADTGAAHDLGSNMDGGHGIHRKSQFPAQRAQERDIPAAAVTEVEALAHGEAPESAETEDQFAHEFFTGLVAHGGIEAEDQHGVGTLNLQRRDALGQRLQESGGFFGSDNRQGVGIEGGHHRGRAAGPSIDLRLSDHMLVSEVDAIEETQGQADAVRSEGLRGAQDGHGHQWAT